MTQTKQQKEKLTHEFGVKKIEQKVLKEQQRNKNYEGDEKSTSLILLSFALFAIIQN